MQFLWESFFSWNLEVRSREKGKSAYHEMPRQPVAFYRSLAHGVDDRQIKTHHVTAIILVWRPEHRMQKKEACQGKVDDCMDGFVQGLTFDSELVKGESNFSVHSVPLPFYVMTDAFVRADQKVLVCFPFRSRSIALIARRKSLCTWCECSFDLKEIVGLLCRLGQCHIQKSALNHETCCAHAVLKPCSRSFCAH